MDRVSVFPGSQVIKMIRFSIFPGSQVTKMLCFPRNPGLALTYLLPLEIFNIFRNYTLFKQLFAGPGGWGTYIHQQGNIRTDGPYMDFFSRNGLTEDPYMDFLSINIDRTVHIIYSRPVLSNPDSIQTYILKQKSTQI